MQVEFIVKTGGNGDLKGNQLVQVASDECICTQVISSHVHSRAWLKGVQCDLMSRSNSLQDT